MDPQKSTMASLLLITGSGRNTGKTTLACRLIESISRKNAITAIKISSHFHKPTPGLVILENNKDFILYKELNKHTEKDSSRMLKAGARFAFYFEVKKGKIEKAFNLFLNTFNPGLPIVCESTSLASIIDPGARLNIISNTSDPIEKDKAMKESPIQINLSVEEAFTILPYKDIYLDNGKWILPSIINPPI